MSKFKVEGRYEYRVKNGKKWTEWFNATREVYDSKEAAEHGLKIAQETSDPIDKITKLKHEFKIVEV